MVLLSPGPAVTVGTPGTPGSDTIASAANAAFFSSRASADAEMFARYQNSARYALPQRQIQFLGRCVEGLLRLDDHRPRHALWVRIWMRALATGVASALGTL